MLPGESKRVSDRSSMHWSVVLTLIIAWLESIAPFLLNRMGKHYSHLSMASSVTSSSGVSGLDSNKGKLLLIHILTRALIHLHSSKVLMNKYLFAQISGVKKKEVMQRWQHLHF